MQAIMPNQHDTTIEAVVSSPPHHARPDLTPKSNFVWQSDPFISGLPRAGIMTRILTCIVNYITHASKSRLRNDLQGDLNLISFHPPFDAQSGSTPHVSSLIYAIIALPVAGIPCNGLEISILC